jgi:RNA polymerase sigma factor (sigma-70 family)
VQPPATDRLTDWFREWQGPLRRFLAARRAVVAADIDDIAQEVFLRMLRYGRSALVKNPQAYLFKIAANVAAEWSMQPGRRQPHDSNWLELLASVSGSESEGAFDISDEQLDNALGALPVRAREVIRLHYAEGLTHEAIAGRLDVSRRIVKRDLIRAYALMRLSLHEDSLEIHVSRKNNVHE